jgi:hypothetical protein
MDEKDFIFIQDNVGNLPKEVIEKAFEEQNKDVLETILYLMNIPKKVEPPKSDWEKRRDIFDTHDAEIQKVLKAPKSF